MGLETPVTRSIRSRNLAGSLLRLIQSNPGRDDNGNLPDAGRPAVEQRLGWPGWSVIPWSSLAELGVIILWAGWVGRAYLNLDPAVWPIGGDFPLSIHGYYVWPLLSRCGACILWNGFINGGVPAFVDMVGAVLHPIAVVATAVLGAVNGAKILTVAGLTMAGIAQWWLAKVMRLGLVPRLWSAGLAVTGGHLAGRMEGGLVGVVFSIGACSLVIAPGLELALKGRRRTAIVLALMLALAFLAGQGYAQLGLVLGLFPAFVVLLFDRQLRLRPVWREFVVAGVLALLLAAIFWVPLLHFWPNYSKPFDGSFSNSQPIAYAPLNLVIRDLAFFKSDLLMKKPLPSFYMSYIGWIPLLFAFLALRLVPRSASRVLSFFLVGIALIYLSGSAVTLKALSRFSQGFTAVRFTSLIDTLAVPLILALAAWGVDRLARFDWPKMTLTFPSGASTSVQVTWLVLGLPLVLGLRATYDFSQDWHKTVRVKPAYSEIIQAATPRGTQWVKFPQNDFVFTPVALDAGLKVTDAYRSFNWKGRQNPPASVIVARGEVNASSRGFLGKVSGLNLVAQPESEYAFVDTGSRQVPCRAVAHGGTIDVECDTNAQGTLVVREHRWAGWTAKRDGARVALEPGQWLSVAAPAGPHRYEFRYRPWDVMVGAIITLVGVALTVWLWRRALPHAPTEETQSPHVEIE